MIRDIKLLRGGQHIGDFRYDEGIRIREDRNAPCLTSSMKDALSNCILLVEVRELNDEGKERN